nr:CHAT domain-containing protein [Nakamurella flavida]
MERTRAAALLAVEPVDGPAVDDDLVALRAAQTELAEATVAGAGDLTPLQARVREIEDGIARLTRGARADRSGSRTVVSPADLRRTLGGRVLVEYAVLDGELLAAVVEPRRTRVVRLGPVAQVRARVGDLLFALRRLSRPGGPAEPARRAADRCLAGLRTLLVEPLRTATDVPVVAVPVGALRRIPWSALWSSPVTVAPSAASWWGSLPRPPDGPGAVALIAGPDLPGAREEVAAIRTAHPDPLVLLPPDSTAAAAAAALRRADLAHLACHSHLRTDNPMFSALQLSDGPLTLHEMGLRGIAPRRMVLAACNTAADTGYAANEVLGFVSALIARGTAGLAASIVVVPDLAAVPLMRRLHTGLAAGETITDALFAARTGMDPEDPADFVSWCAFNAYGGS